MLDTSCKSKSIQQVVAHNPTDPQGYPPSTVQMEWHFMEPPDQKLVIGVVGVCGAGKSTLMQALKKHGIKIHHIAQEHSYVQSMWQRIIHPDLLIYLNVSYPETIRRRNLDWTIYEYQEQLRRLEHARQHADLTIETDTASEDEVLEQVLYFLTAHDVYPHYPVNNNQ